MPDISPYGVTQDADAEMVTANALVGERAGNVTAHQAGAAFSPAVFSTAPYVPPRSELKRGPKGCVGRNGECGAPAIRGSDLCFFHSPEIIP